MNATNLDLPHYDGRVNAFPPAVLDAVVAHMNGDHADDNLLIARAFGRPEATASEMIGLDADAGVWRVTDAAGTSELRVSWPDGPISERPEIRREVAALYREACARLGVPAREEHQPEAEVQKTQGDHPHGGGHPHGGHHGASEADDSFAQQIREATWGDHSDSEGSTFMEDIMRGRAGVAEYAALAVQHHVMYEALESAAQLLAADPDYAVFHPPALIRLPAIEEDLAFLLGPAWRDQIEPVPATQAYADRIREVAAEGWLPGIVAHHYTRYLGDLSGGQMIAKLVARQHGFDRLGVAFYDFSALGPIPEFKQAYREGLNALGARLSEEERERMIAEVRRAYHFNTASFVDMDRARGVAA